jgi:hypothetical protein
MLPDRKALCGRKQWNSGGAGSNAIPSKLAALGSSNERQWLSSLIKEMRTKLAMDLDPVPNLERGMGLQSKPKRSVDYLIVGSSNAARLTRAINQTGYTVCKIINMNWRITRESCESMANTITETIDQEDPAAVVLFMMDGSVFYTRGQDGSRTLPRRGEDGKFHIKGDLTVCSQEIQAEHLNTMKPILDAVGRRPCIVISPMPRYVVEGCCQDPEHVKNRGERYFRDNMQRQLDGVARSIKNFLFKTHRRNMRVLESSYNIRNLPNVDIWFTDPVHPIDSVYNNLAAGVIKMAATLRDLESRQDLKRRRADSWETMDPERRPREGGAGSRGGFPRGHYGRGGPRGDRGGHGGHQYGGLGGPRR